MAYLLGDLNLRFLPLNFPKACREYKELFPLPYLNYNLKNLLICTSVDLRLTCMSNFY
jgi:hypothetical protein